MAKSLKFDTIISQVKQMRELQKSYWAFKAYNDLTYSQKKKILIASKEAEQSVDNLIKEWECRNQLSFFPKDE